MNFNDRTLPVVTQLTRLVNVWRAYDRRGHDVLGEHFTAADMQMMNVVAEFPHRNTTELASLLGVTKGAVSQLVSRLVERGLLERYRGVDNHRDSYARLSARGAQAYRAQLSRFEADIQGIDELLRSAQPQEVAFLMSFLGNAEAFFRRQLDQPSPPTSV